MRPYITTEWITDTQARSSAIPCIYMYLWVCEAYVSMFKESSDELKSQQTLCCVVQTASENWDIDLASYDLFKTKVPKQLWLRFYVYVIKASMWVLWKHRRSHNSTAVYRTNTMGHWPEKLSGNALFHTPWNYFKFWSSQTLLTPETHVLTGLLFQIRHVHLRESVTPRP